MAAECEERDKVSEGASHFVELVLVSYTGLDYGANMGKRGDNHSWPAIYCSRDLSEYDSFSSTTGPIITDTG